MRWFATFVVTILVALAGCGGDDSAGGGSPGASTPAAPAPAAEDGITVAALGDSITSGSPGFDPDPEARSALGFGDDQRSQFEYWAHRADTALEFDNCGVFGERTDEIATRLDDCVTGADVIIVQGGINDIAQALAGGPEAATAAARQAVVNIDGMLTQAEDLGLEVYVTDVLPWNNGHPYADDAIAEINAGIEKVAKTHSVPVIHFHDALLDPGNAGLMAQDLTADGDHPSVEGYRMLGELVAGELG